MENSPKISVIIPIWNMEKYLQKCLESVINQTYKNLEIICINNGSTDHSEEILREYCAKDNRIKLITQNHTSLGEARNRGLEEISGEYVTFVDADDWLEPNVYKNSINKYLEDNQLDLIIFPAQCYIEQQNGIIKKENENWYNFKFSGKYNLKKNDTFYYISRVAWNKVFKVSIIKEHDIKFAQNCYHEDVYFYFLYSLYCENMYCLEQIGYNYLKRETSSLRIWTQKDFTQWFCDHFKILTDIYNTKIKNTQNENLRTCYIYGLYKNVLLHLPACDNLNAEEYKKIKSCLKNFVNLIDPLINDNFTTYVKNGQFDKIARLKLPLITLGNNLLNLNIYRQEKNYICILSLGRIRIKINSGKNYLKKILNTVFSIKKDNNHKIINILGIKFKLKDTKERTELDKQFKAQIKVLKEFISTEIYSANIIRDLHSKTFPQFKNCHPDKDIVIVACGPSMAYYKPIKDAIHIGVNKAFKNENIKMDYIFIQDKLSIQNYIEELLAYPAKIFMGSYILNGISWLYKCKIPLKYMDYDNINYYYSDYGRNLLLPYLEYCSLMDFGSVAFPAAQFALYTNPKRLYIVGCDCSSGGYFDGSKNTNVKNHNLSYLIKDWQRFKLYAETYYPDVEIISINPVGLKGMFKDVYTQEYIDANPELFTDIGYEILEEQVNEYKIYSIK